MLPLPLLSLATLLATLPLAQDPTAAPAPDRVRALLAAPLPDGVAEAPAEGFTLTRSDRLEFHARALPIHDVFAQLREATRRNVVVAPGVQAAFTGDLYDLSPDQAIEMICRATGLQAREQGGYVFVDLVAPETRVYVLEYARAADLVPVLQPLVGQAGRVAASSAAQQGIESSPTEAGGDNFASSEVLVVSALPDIQEQVAAVVASFDERPRQLLLEATILSAELDDSTSLGIDFQALGGVDFRAWGATSPDGLSLANGAIGGGQLEQGVAAAGTSVAAGLPANGLRLGFIDGDVGVFLRALREITNTSILANPKVTALNKQRGEVLLGRKDGYITTTVSETSTSQTIEYIETGTRLIYRPFIGEDGLIRLEVHPEDSEGGVNDLGLPFKETAEVTTNILVRDGQTVVIGGLFREKVRSTVSKVPGLGDVPFFGALFRGNSDEMVREEIVVLLTPHILDLDAEEADPAAAAAPGADRAPARRLYLQAARARAEAGDAAGALALLRAARPEAASADLRGLVSRTLVPQAPARAADRALLAELLALRGEAE